MTDTDLRTLAAADYAIVALMLTCSTCIGIYHAHKGRKNKQGTEGYLLASRSMNFLPVAISIAVNFKSAVTVIGTPADIYQFGIIYAWNIVVIVFIAVPFVWFLILPVLYNLRISSAYEYLEKRYGRSVRIIATIGYMLQTLLYMGVNVYGPALALSRGFPQSATMLTTGMVCVVYTTLGGLRGVIWSDVFQAAVLTAAMLMFVIKGTAVAGGADVVWNHMVDGGRSNLLRFDPDPRLRYTFWSTVIGFSVIWIGQFGTSQTNIQRFISVNSLTQARWALLIGGWGIAILTSISVGCGVVLYALFHSCDPIVSGCIDKRDENGTINFALSLPLVWLVCREKIMPYAVMEIFQAYPGMRGLFIAGVLSASLSTVSSGLNSMVSLIITDYIKPNTEWSDSRYERASKVLTVCLGLIILATGFASSTLGALVTMTAAITGSFSGPFIGIFMMGIWTPFYNSWGAGVGFVSGAALSFITFLGGLGVDKPVYLTQKLPVSTSLCRLECSYLDSINTTSTYQRNELRFTTEQPNTDASSYAQEYEYSFIENYLFTSFIFIPFIGLVVSVIVGTTVSLLSGGWKNRGLVDKSTIDPISMTRLNRCLPRGLRKHCSCICKTNCDERRKYSDEVDMEDVNTPFTS